MKQAVARHAHDRVHIGRIGVGITVAIVITIAMVVAIGGGRCLCRLLLLARFQVQLLFLPCSLGCARDRRRNLARVSGVRGQRAREPRVRGAQHRQRHALPHGGRETSAAKRIDEEEQTPLVRVPAVVQRHGRRIGGR